MFGELLATALQYRGARGLVIDASVRDAAALVEMEFPVWSAGIWAQGTVKATAGSVNVPIVVGGQLVRPGDAIVADDDGVVCVARETLDAALAASGDRAAREEEARAAFADGQLGLDRYNLRPLLERLGVEYVSHDQYAEESGQRAP
jgi:4-hydroxy-4-methyl-2-oxoglutarate aldolase